MIRVWYCNRLDRLAERLASALAPAGLDPAAGLFARRPVIVPNPQIAAYLRYEVARAPASPRGCGSPVRRNSWRASCRNHSLPCGCSTAPRCGCCSWNAPGPGPAGDPGQPLPEPVQTYLDAAGDDSVPATSGGSS